jgi:hypothetical protein
MSENLADTLVWMLRAGLFAGLAWGAWLCIDELLLPGRPERVPGLEHFATFALVVLLLISTLGGILHAG